MFIYPKEIIADTYLSKVGGFSSELENSEIGINAKALEINTSIISNETKASIKFLDDRIIPYFLRRRYTVVGLEEHMEGYEYSQQGEVVFSTELRKEFSEKLGRDVIINTVESFRIDGDFTKVIKALKQEMVPWGSGNRWRKN
jgi:hypothetical protein